MAGILTLNNMLRNEQASSRRLSAAFSERFFAMQAERTQPLWCAYYHLYICIWGKVLIHAQAFYQGGRFVAIIYATCISRTNTSSIDYGYPTTEPMIGETRANGSAVRWVSRLLLKANEVASYCASLDWISLFHVTYIGTQDEYIGQVLLVVRHLLAPESALIQPNMVLRILWAHVKRTLSSGKKE